MGFVDNLSRHPSGESLSVSYDGKKIVSVNQISTLLGFEHLKPRYSGSQLRNKFSQQIFFHDTIYCNAIGQSANCNANGQSARNELRTLQNFCKLYSHTSKFQCVKIYIRPQKTVFDLAKPSIVPLTTNL